MITLYRMPFTLPSLSLALALAVLLSGCDSKPPPKQAKKPPSNVYLDAIKEAEAVKGTVDERNQRQGQVEALLEEKKTQRR